MELLEAIRVRHTVRNYSGRAIEGEDLAQLSALIQRVNAEGGLNFRLINGVENALSPYRIRYGRWTGVSNYIAIVGQEAPDLEERCGYYGQQIVLWAQTAGLRTGWVETSYEVEPEVLGLQAGERMVLALVIGYSEEDGRPRKLKTYEDLTQVQGEVPEWFRRGVETALYAPTAGNQMLFSFGWDGSAPSISTKVGLLEQVDLGIAKLYFELGSGMAHDAWR